MTYVCPRCGSRSEHPIDETEGYCGACRDWTRIERAAPFIARVVAVAVERHEARMHPKPQAPVPPSEGAK